MKRIMNVQLAQQFLLVNVQVLDVLLRAVLSLFNVLRTALLDRHLAVERAPVGVHDGLSVKCRGAGVC